MKKLTKTILSLLVAGGFNCAVTDYALQPVDSISGKDLKKEIAASASLGFLSGITQNPNATAMSQNGSTVASSNFMLASLMAGNTSTRLLNIDEKKYYTNTSAAECKDAVFNAYFGAIIGMIEPPPISGSMISKEMCNLKTTGKIIHFSDSLSL